ncbi:MAG: patatin family protein [Candidatus Fimenecus sp.]
MKTGIVVEGGAMRAVYNAGVLDVLLENSIFFDYLIGVSAGAGNSASYISKQNGRAYRCNTEYIHDKRFMGVDPLLKHHSFFGLDFIVDSMAYDLEPFDFDEFYRDNTELVIGVTNALTGQDEYFTKDFVVEHKTLDPFKASCAVPIFCQPVVINGVPYFDGGVADSIPVKKALEDGCDRLVIVLTREKGFQKRPEALPPVYKRILSDYPKVAESLEQRHIKYNETLKLIDELENEGRAIVVQSESPLDIWEVALSRSKLDACYDRGRLDCLQRLQDIKDFIRKQDNIKD